MPSMRVVPLGAGQDVGRSCVLVTLGGKNIMFDCGMHMGYSDLRRFPDFSFISRTGNFTAAIDVLIISHFHLDHCGALPYFTEVCGYDKQVYMTYPTKAISPILLEDYRKIMVDRKGEKNFFSPKDIKKCVKKMVALNLHQTYRVDDLEICPYYAGHVLGAAMFHVRSRTTGESVLYTGDYNMTPDRHLGAAAVDQALHPDLLITETTYATTIRDSKRSREHEFLTAIHECVNNGGKVLIPVFALGRAQELCILIETYWERMNLAVPIYFSAGLVEKANYYYQLFINWTNQKLKNTFVKRNMFEFNHIKPFDRSFIDRPGPMVLFATPGMLHAGMSLEVFKRWAPVEKNLVIIPGYCVQGTVGNKVLRKRHGKIELDREKKNFVDVRCTVKNLSFSAHADAKGILKLVRQVEPKNVVLVHGERNRMEFLKGKIVQDFGLNCWMPANGETVEVETFPPINVDISASLVKQHTHRRLKRTNVTHSDSDNNNQGSVEKEPSYDNYQPPLKKARVEGIMVVPGQQRSHSSLRRPCLYGTQEAAARLGMPLHRVRFSGERDGRDLFRQDQHRAPLNVIKSILHRWLPSKQLEEKSNFLRINSIHIVVKDSHQIIVSWSLDDEDLASKVLSLLDDEIQTESHSNTAGTRSV
eukprot:gb/GECH01010038.1/.p1 GENE.gb/GECH01010038.1/~~gb/GECH01010038.1/.p1  ORF type:complete len:645 (+),score=101.70 gb/GECH01010038.1/:1-1935(+)